MLGPKLLVATAVLAAAAAGPADRAHATTAPAPLLTRGVVLVETNLAYQNAQAAGTGIVLTSSGEVLTNNHVIRGATTITVIVPATNAKYSASVLGYDVDDDVALIKLDGASHLATATRGNSARLVAGQVTHAVGNANGAGRLVTTTGKITGLRRSIAVQNDDGTTSRLTGLVQTSARLVPGDSGGPLLDAKGRVVAVDAAGSPNYRFEASDGYAIPINKALSLVKLMEKRTATPLVHIGKTAFLGVSVSAAPQGLTVQSVVPGGAAASAGIRKGDVITSLDGSSIASLDDLRTALFKHHPGDAVTLGIEDVLGDPTQASITLADGPPQ